jgi:hypothetical protein
MVVSIVKKAATAGVIPSPVKVCQVLAGQSINIMNSSMS